MKKMISLLYWQMYNLILLPNRLDEYQYILRSAQAAGYHFVRLDKLNELIKASQPIPQPFIVLRHDIDADCKAAKCFCDIEAKLGIEASYFFRSKTWETKYMQYIASYGHEIGYHYEELATFAKQNHLYTNESIEPHITDMQLMLSRNITSLRKLLPFTSLASHGDFANRKLGIRNCVLVQNSVWRDENSISYEAYDEHLFAVYKNHVSDKPYPIKFTPAHPLQFISNRQSFLFLSHPRWWKPDPIKNITELLSVFKEQILW